MIQYFRTASGRLTAAATVRFPMRRHFLTSSPVLALLLTGLSCGDGPTGAGGDLRARWSQAQDGNARAQPAVVGDVVYFGTGDGRVVARARETGAQRWSTVVAPGEAVRGRNLLERGGVLVVPVALATVGLDATTGEQLWRYASPRDTVGRGPNADPGSVIAARVEADDAAAYIPAWGASVSAVDLRTGAVRWVWEPGVSAGDTAAGGRFRSGAQGVRVSGDTVFATVWHFLDAQGLKSEAWLVALHRAAGVELWRVVLPSYTGGVLVNGAPALYARLAIFTTVGGRTWAIDRFTRQLVWQFVPPARYSTQTQAELGGDAVFIDGGDDFLYALDATSGAVRWKSNAGNGATRDLLVTDRRVYYPTNGSLRVFDRATGRAIAGMEVKPVGDAVETAATTDGRGRIFVTVTKAAQSYDEP